MGNQPAEDHHRVPDGQPDGDGADIKGRPNPGERLPVARGIDTGDTAPFRASTVQQAGDDGDVARLDVSVQGVNLGTHQVKVLVNGSAVGTMTFDGQRLAAQTFSLPPSLLKEGTNSVQLMALAGASDISLVDTLRFNYTRRYAADNNQLRFTAQGGQQVALNGFTSTNIRVMDVTDPNSPQELRGTLSGGKTGHDICYQLKQNPATSFIPVILISGTMNLAETAQRCGADGFICKPFDVDELLRQVRAY